MTTWYLQPYALNRYELAIHSRRRFIQILPHTKKSLVYGYSDLLLAHFHTIKNSHLFDCNLDVCLIV